jgi:hypothetical protein
MYFNPLLLHVPYIPEPQQRSIPELASLNKSNNSEPERVSRKKPIKFEIDLLDTSQFYCDICKCFKEGTRLKRLDIKMCEDCAILGGVLQYKEIKDL